MRIIIVLILLAAVVATGIVQARKTSKDSNKDNTGKTPSKWPVAIGLDPRPYYRARLAQLKRLLEVRKRQVGAFRRTYGEERGRQLSLRLLEPIKKELKRLQLLWKRHVQLQKSLTPKKKTVKKIRKGKKRIIMNKWSKGKANKKMTKIMMKLKKKLKMKNRKLKRKLTKKTSKLKKKLKNKTKTGKNKPAKTSRKMRKKLKKVRKMKEKIRKKTKKLKKRINKKNRKMKKKMKMKLKKIIKKMKRKPKKQRGFNARKTWRKALQAIRKKNFAGRSPRRQWYKKQGNAEPLGITRLWMLRMGDGYRKSRGRSGKANKVKKRQEATSGIGGIIWTPQISLGRRPTTFKRRLKKKKKKLESTEAMTKTSVEDKVLRIGPKRKEIRWEAILGTLIKKKKDSTPRKPVKKIHENSRLEKWTLITEAPPVVPQKKPETEEWYPEWAEIPEVNVSAVLNSTIVPTVNETTVNLQEDIDGFVDDLESEILDEDFGEREEGSDGQDNIYQGLEDQETEGQYPDEQGTGDQDTDYQESEDQDTDYLESEDQDTDYLESEDQDSDFQDTDYLESEDQDSDFQDTDYQESEDQDSDFQDIDYQESGDQDSDFQDTDNSYPDTDYQGTEDQDADDQETDDKDADDQETEDQDADDQETEDQDEDDQETEDQDEDDFEDESEMDTDDDDEDSTVSDEQYSGPGYSNYNSRKEWRNRQGVDGNRYGKKRGWPRRPLDSQGLYPDVEDVSVWESKWQRPRRPQPSMSRPDSASLSPNVEDEGAFS